MDSELGNYEAASPHTCDKYWQRTLALRSMRLICSALLSTGGKIKRQFGGEAEQKICVCKWIAESTEVRKNRRNRSDIGGIRFLQCCVLRGWVAKRERLHPPVCHGGIYSFCAPPPFSFPPFLSLSVLEPALLLRLAQPGLEKA